MIIDGVEILGVGEPIPGMEVTWQSILKRLNFLIKSKTIGLRKALDFPALAIGGGAIAGVVGTAVILLNQNSEAMKSGQIESVTKQFEDNLKLLGLDPEQEAEIKDELNRKLPTEEEIEKAQDEPTICPVTVEWYKQPAVWIVSLSSLAIISTIIYFIMKGKKR